MDKTTISVRKRNVKSELFMSMKI